MVIIEKIFFYDSLPILLYLFKRNKEYNQIILKIIY